MQTQPKMPKAKKAAKKTTKKKAVAKKPKLTRNRTDLPDGVRMSILRQVSEGVPVRIVAMNHGLKYGVVRTTAFSEWLRSFPDHFKKHGSRKTFTNLRKFPLPEKVEAAA